MKKETITLALTGNPNSGKTTIFNNLTGTRQHVGNWPGVTVEKKEGTVLYNGYRLRVVDLPGTYSLTAYSIEEIVARRFLVDAKPEVVVDIVDASNLERNLYLATQLIELGVKLILVLNMADVANARGHQINADVLGKLLGVPVVFTVGTRNEGTKALLDKVVEVAEDRDTVSRHIHISYGHEMEKEIKNIQDVIWQDPSIGQRFSTRWLAVKLLENDTAVKERVHEFGEIGGKILDQAEASRTRLNEFYQDDPEMVLTDQRYGFIGGALKEVLKISSQSKFDLSRQVDLVLTNRILGFPVFVFFIWAMFQLTFTVGAYPMDWIDAGVGWFGALVSGLLPPGLLRDLLVNGIIAGVGSVIIFLPNILLLFFCISLFEDTGYMARAAFIMDRVMHVIGLHGKSFIPMLMGFGCNAPAIMATRTLESERDRLLSILINPLISCSARLPVYILLAGTFFGASAGNVIFSIYALGIALAIGVGKLFRVTLFRGEIAPFVMELPPYRVPTLKSLLIHMWDRSQIFLRKMGGVILVGSIVVWFLGAFPRNVELSVGQGADKVGVTGGQVVPVTVDGSHEPLPSTPLALGDNREQAMEQARLEKSFLGKLGHAIQPVFDPLGFDWRTSVAVLTGFVAKEIVVSTLGVLHATGADANEESEALRRSLRASGMTPLGAYALMAFVLIYIPCLATVAVIRRETNSWKWTGFSVGYSLVLAWGVSCLIYQGGLFLGIGI
ncbi:MAG: ferrous iron transport protein B [Deltaproteobacteria bacterium]|nr:MAG: ferrous iron transport protein B [Deltaproteobacteria bacterium]